MNGEKLTPITNKPSLWALSPLLVFLCLYLVTSIIVNDFYKVPITIAFMVSSVYAVCITKGLSLNERMLQYSIGAANKNIMLMIWIFILAGAFAQSAKDIGAIDATVNLTLLLLPDNLLLAGIFLAACFISLSIGTSVEPRGTSSRGSRHRRENRHEPGLHDRYRGGRSLLRRQPFIHLGYHHRRHPYPGMRHA